MDHEPNGAPSDVDLLIARRDQLRSRRAVALTTLMDERADLRGVHALADYVHDAIRWSA